MMRCPTCRSEIDLEAAFCPFCGERVPGGPSYEFDEWEYEAFISYRHLPRDRDVAVRLQRRLEGMSIPRGIREESGRARLGKLFRDEDELPTSSSLPDQIRDALMHSRYLIVICSPHTNESKWVQREVELFASFHGRDRVRLALAEGDSHESIPMLLRSRLSVGEDGELVSVDEEPLSADLRSDDRKRFRSESLRIAAPIIGCGYDDLVQRMHARRMRAIAIATSAAAVFSTAFGSFSFYQQRQIERNYRLTQINESEARAIQSRELLAAGDRMEAIEVALAALPGEGAGGDRPFVPSAQIALQEALYANTPASFWRSCYALPDTLHLYALSEGGLQATFTTGGEVQASRVGEGVTLASVDVASALEAHGVTGVGANRTAISFCGENLLLIPAQANEVALFDAQNGENLWWADLRDIPGDLRGESVTVAPDDSILVVGIRDASDHETLRVSVCFIDAVTGELLKVIELTRPGFDTAQATEDVRLAFAPDSYSLAVSCSKTLWNLSLRDGSSTFADLTQNDAYRLAYLDDAIVSVTAEGGPVSLLLGSAYFDAFTPTLEPLWSREELPRVHMNSRMSPVSNNAFLLGEYVPEGEAPLLVYVTGDTTKFVDPRTGEQRMGVTSDSPLRAACLGPSRLETVDCDGVLTSYVIVDSSREVTPYSSVEVAEGEFATIANVDGGIYAAVWDPVSYRYRVYRSLGRTADVAGYEAIEDLEALNYMSIGVPSKDFPQLTPILMQSDTQLCVLDPATFEPRWTIEKATLGLGETLKTNVTGGHLLAYSDQPHNGALTVIDLSWDTGEVIRRHDIPQDGYGWSTLKDVRVIDVDGTPALALYVDNKLWFLGLENLDPLGVVPSLEGEVVDFFRVGSQTVVVYSGTDNARLGLYTFKLGEPVESALDTLTLAHASETFHDVALSWEGDRLLVCCADGLMRCLDTGSWEVLWEREVGSVQISTFSADGRYVVVQDTSGVCMLLSARTGKVLRSSSVELPLIRYFVANPDDPGELDALCIYQGLLTGEANYISLSLEEGSFGPTACINSGVVCSTDRERVFSIDAYLGDYGTQRVYTLDELIDLAHEQLQGHELTDVDRQLLRIDN